MLQISIEVNVGNFDETNLLPAVVIAITGGIVAHYANVAMLRNTSENMVEFQKN